MLDVTEGESEFVRDTVAQAVTEGDIVTDEDKVGDVVTVTETELTADIVLDADTDAQCVFVALVDTVLDDDVDAVGHCDAVFVIADVADVHADVLSVAEPLPERDTLEHPDVVPLTEYVPVPVTVRGDVGDTDALPHIDGEADGEPECDVVDDVDMDTEEHGVAVEHADDVDEMVTDTLTVAVTQAVVVPVSVADTDAVVDDVPEADAAPVADEHVDGVVVDDVDGVTVADTEFDVVTVDDTDGEAVDESEPVFVPVRHAVELSDPDAVTEMEMEADGDTLRVLTGDSEIEGDDDVDMVAERQIVADVDGVDVTLSEGDPELECDAAEEAVTQLDVDSELDADGDGETVLDAVAQSVSVLVPELVRLGVPDTEELELLIAVVVFADVGVTDCDPDSEFVRDVVTEVVTEAVEELDTHADVVPDPPIRDAVADTDVDAESEAVTDDVVVDDTEPENESTPDGVKEPVSVGERETEPDEHPVVENVIDDVDDIVIDSVTLGDDDTLTEREPVGETVELLDGDEDEDGHGETVPDRDGDTVPE